MFKFYYFFALSFLYYNGVHSNRSCPKLRAPSNGKLLNCWRSKENSKCYFSCNPGFVKSSGSTATCRCDPSGCKWVGETFACRRKPVVTAQSSQAKVCKYPDFSQASFGVVEISPNGAFIRLQLRPKKVVDNGFTIALVFPRAFPQDVTFSAGQVDVTRAENPRILVVNSKDHNEDISSMDVYSFYIQLKSNRRLNPSLFTALVGFYNEKMSASDVNCILDEVKVRPTPKPTTSPVTRSTTAKPTPKPTTSKQTPKTTTTKQTPKPTTTKQTPKPTTTEKPETNPTSTTKQPVVPDGCEILSNEGDKPGYIILNSGWEENGVQKFSARAQVFKEANEINNWIMKLEFDTPVNDIETFIANAEGPFSNGNVWILKPKSFNVNQQTLLQILMLIKHDGTSAPSCRVTFCNNGASPNMGTTATTSSPDNSLTTSEPVVPGNRCSGPASQLPSFSRQTDTSGYTQLEPSYLNKLKYDYNQVLHYSLLFYEAQRSGKILPDTRIGFRGDSGLKDGCDVGIDLSKGYYDAGDNVKFGFPMAFTVTTVAWGMIEFEDAYKQAGEYARGLEMIKWATDYFIAAHPTKYELYAQVMDASEDHGRWERPEEAPQKRRLYKIDQNNPGTELAAETSAALSAASVLFKDEDPAYSDLLISHAEELYQFADLYRKNYHHSVPGVSSYYKSWSGFNDELLWGLAWLYKATGVTTYLEKIESVYDSLGGGNTPSEFSWDNKIAGVQVLMASLTGKSKYREDVQNFIDLAISTKTTPMGLTWKSRWGPNRYAANYAAIAAVAGKISPPLQNRQGFLRYAKQQINYLLGDNEIDSSYVVGFGKNPPKRPHHRASSCPAWRNLSGLQKCDFNSGLNPDQDNPHVLYGALVGGPDEKGNYVDSRKDYVANEVATDYNAGFQTAVAGVLHYTLNEELN